MPEQSAPPPAPIEPAPSPVIVTPIPAEKSRTIARAKLMMIWTVVASVIPDLVQVILHLAVNDSQFAAWLAKFLPPGLRYGAMLVIVTYAQNQIKLRKSTVAPIAGTDAAERTLPLFRRPE